MLYFSDSDGQCVFFAKISSDVKLNLLISFYYDSASFIVTTTRPVKPVDVV